MKKQTNIKLDNHDSTKDTIFLNTVDFMSEGKQS